MLKPRLKTELGLVEGQLVQDLGLPMVLGGGELPRSNDTKRLPVRIVERLALDAHEHPVLAMAIGGTILGSAGILAGTTYRHHYHH